MRDYNRVMAERNRLRDALQAMLGLSTNADGISRENYERAFAEAEDAIRTCQTEN